ncbi:hypothetical protein KSP40_PGU002543 [Platanthera guangdongensis]|uniref:Uncharacterized protein n=1 Tax=Platanthera guangdongensis TaxID=2320717 RepID=A0ABR2MGZ8_9ASPA
MRETIPSYPDLVHQVEAQITADEAIDAHRQQFEGAQKRRREKEAAPQHQEGRFQEGRQNKQCRRDHQRDQPPRDYTTLNNTRTNMLYATPGNRAPCPPRTSRKVFAGTYTRLTKPA